MEIIQQIKSIINEFDSNAVDALNEIKKVISESEKPDFSQIKNGERFMYHGIEFVRLGLEQGGVLCMTVKPYATSEFNTNSCNNWVESDAQKLLNTKFLSLMDESDLVPFEADLTADNGDTSYDKCVDMIGILSCDLYRKYRNNVPLFEGYVWTCTPRDCSTPSSSCADNVRVVYPDGTLGNVYASLPFGLAPACIFRI